MTCRGMSRGGQGLLSISYKNTYRAGSCITSQLANKINKPDEEEIFPQFFTIQLILNCSSESELKNSIKVNCRNGTSFHSLVLVYNSL